MWRVCLCSCGCLKPNFALRLHGAVCRVSCDMVPCCALLCMVMFWVM